MNRQCRGCGTRWDEGETCPSCHTVAYPFAAVVWLGTATVVYSHPELTEVCNRLERFGQHYSVFWASPYLTPQSTVETSTTDKAEA